MSLLTAYAEALTTTGQTAVHLLSPTCRFASPFSTWSTPEDVAAVYQARAAAIASVRVERTLRSRDGGGAVVWTGEVDGERVEGCELITCADSAIEQVDLFLRPAGVLPAVLQAMRASWPASP